MRVVQLIDSLEAGGAERMAVNYANTLMENCTFSALVATRKEGLLKAQLNPNVAYLFLNKKRTWDANAVLKLRKFICDNKIQVIQAHSSSFFLAVLVKLCYPKIKIIWHDHYGNSDFLSERPKRALQLASMFFSAVIVVNEKLHLWVKEYLKCQNTIYLPNFAVVNQAVSEPTQLKGQAGKRILCLANLREQKNHLMLVKVAAKLKESHPEWSLHLLGKDLQDDYSRMIKNSIQEHNLSQQLYMYDTCLDVEAIIAQVEIGILTSISEGLPVAVLEYALGKKVVLATNVGQIAALVEDNKNGFLVPSNDVEMFYNRLVQLIENPSLRDTFSERLNDKVEHYFSATSTIKKYICWVQKTIINE